jgi:hypothetical protein
MVVTLRKIEALPYFISTLDNIEQLLSFWLNLDMKIIICSLLLLVIIVAYFRIVKLSAHYGRARQRNRGQQENSWTLVINTNFSRNRSCYKSEEMIYLRLPIKAMKNTQVLDLRLVNVISQRYTVKSDRRIFIK